ncbi:hypothetical protein OV079_52100 [Nannocystis pusilla]|uniref:Uncharacterized protein n=1 Tax=Nannocystis pusilla TaxID=889268 RepID=A0A9X3F239_9BACT|nr:hypothetical protein [Nannocystis pusilla]MCY1013935.1 hypothetical protein [Nannocystis pusilla]
MAHSDDNEWEQLTRGRPFIANLGYQPNYVQKVPDGPPMLMGRFAVFAAARGPGAASNRRGRPRPRLSTAEYEVTDDLVLHIQLAAG